MIKKLSEREHILQRPTMYIGAINKTLINEYILENEKIEYKEIEYIPALIKIINEIIDNSVDVAIKTNFKVSNEISIKMEKDCVVVQDNGSGIPVTKNFDGHYLPELCWGHARAGSNFEDDKNRTQIGMNGVGSFATNCFSTKFIGKTDDGKNSYTITFKDNAGSFTEKVQESSGKTGTTVTFYPDLARFDITEIDEVHFNVIKQRLINLSMTFPEITFKFNSKKININSFKKYISLFNETAELYETEEYKFAILPNDTDDFRQFSYVNGLKIPDGGTHIDYIINNIVAPIREKLVKKYSGIKPADIKNKLMVVAFLKNVKNTKFNSQTKEKITNSTSEISSYYGNIDFTKITNKILKTPAIIDPITEVYKIKEELKKRQDLKNVDKAVKKPKSEKFMPPIGEWTNIFLAEGDSASNSISKILGRQGNGFYAMFGVPPNAYDMDIKDIISSKKMLDLQQILGLQFSKTVQENINFKNIIITTDFDLPGHFIAGQLFGLFYRFGKNLFEEHRIKRLITPLIVVKDSKENIVTWFYSFDDYRLFEEKNLNKKYKYDYKKGLGSWSQKDLEYVIEQDGLENMLEVMTLDDSSSKLVDDWLSSSKADKRKEMLDGYEFNIMNL